jgi:hypothetical protein
MTNSSFRAEMFHAVFTPDNATLMYNIKGVSLTTARVLLDIQVCLDVKLLNVQL